MTGWGGNVTISAVRFCADHGVAILMLDWNRDLMSLVATPAPRAAHLLKRQCGANPLPMARAIIAAKVIAHEREGALSTPQCERWLDRLSAAPTVAALLMIEAHAASEAWSERHVQIRWREAGYVPRSWSFVMRSGGAWGSVPLIALPIRSTVF